MKKYYVQNGSVFLCRLNKKFQDNTNSDTCEFRTINPKGIAEHISYHHREDSLILLKFIRRQFEPKHNYKIFSESNEVARNSDAHLKIEEMNASSSPNLNQHCTNISAIVTRKGLTGQLTKTL